MTIKIMWLGVMLAGMAWWLRRDIAAYRRFMLLTDTADRQRVYWQWIVQSFAILAGASVLSLWLADALNPFDAFPAAFNAAHHALRPEPSAQSSDSLLGAAIGAGVGIAVLLLVQWWRIKRMLAPVQGTVDALLPRNGRESAIALVLSINAGVSEELFFRMALPLLLFQITGSLWSAFVLAGVAFGLAHAYQGWRGIAGTMLVGGLLTLSYLASGSLLRVMVIHAAIDVVALIVRPALSQWVARRTAPQAAAMA